MNDEAIEMCLDQSDFKFNWLCYYQDETYLSQYSKDGTENLYMDIDHDKLHFFALVDGEHFFCVNLEDGSFIINGIVFRFDLPEEAKSEKNIKYNLEYWRKTVQTINSNEPISIRYFFGWRLFAGEDKKRIVRALIIEEDGTLTAVDHY